jgi:enoyl-CoA hydratase/carnithine racemase
MTTETKIDTGTDELLCVIRDRVAIITLNRPEVRNAMSDTLTPALRTMIRTCGENPDVGALLLTGAGTAFCAGGNVKGMGAHRDKKKLEMSYDEKVADLQERQRLLTGALASVRKPTIAALPGPAVGAGLALAMACDIRIAAQSAFVSTGYLRVALSGDYGIADAAGRHGAGARTDVHRREGRCGAMRGDRPRQPRGARRQASGGSLCTGQIHCRRADTGASLHEGQSRRSAAVRFCHRARP